MDNEMRKQIFDETIRIADEILSQAKQDTNGIFWNTMSMGKDQKILWGVNEGIYSGVSGICLFYLELYKQTRNEKYLHAAVEGMRWVDHSCQNLPSGYYAFYTGRMGVSFAMIKMYEALDDRSYLEKALRIAQSCDTFLKEFPCDDLLNGIAGTILGLLHLHAATREDWLLEKIDLFTGHLIDNAHHAQVGLYWDRSYNNVRGLCGFSHGAAGIGFVFLELGHYFKNETFYWFAEQAFAYENQWFHEKMHNWPDFRKGIWQEGDLEKFEKAYLEKDMDFFTQPTDMNAWCHGAAGIGMARLRGHQLLHKYSEDIEKAVQKIIKTHVTALNPHLTYTLCHGAGGNADLFLQAFDHFKQEPYAALAERVAVNALQIKHEKGFYISGLAMAGSREDISLFMGNAGLGYFYLRVLNPEKTPSVLSHPVNSTYSCQSKYSSLSLSGSEARKRIINKYFNRTLVVTEAVKPEVLKVFFFDKTASNSVNVRHAFIEFIEKNIYPQSIGEKCILDVFALEIEKVKMDEAIRSLAYLYIQELFGAQGEQLIANTGIDFSRKASLGEHVRILDTKWNWSTKEPQEWIANLEKVPGVHPVLIRSTYKEVIETNLSMLAYILLTNFSDKFPVDQGIDNTINAFEADSVEYITSMKSTIHSQIKEALSAGILSFDDNH